jgi:hypothetical protein
MNINLDKLFKEKENKQKFSKSITTEIDYNLYHPKRKILTINGFVENLDQIESENHENRRSSKSN